MRIFLITAMVLCFLALPVSATEYTAPVAPESAQPYMPAEQESFAEGLWFIIKNALVIVRPEIINALEICFRVIPVVLLVSVMDTITSISKNTIQLTAAVVIGILLMSPLNSMIQIGRSTIIELTDYGKLLLPIMTTALATQGGFTSSAAIYTGTVLFNTLLSTIITKLIIPALYIYFCISIANSALQQDILKRIKKFIKWLMTWSLKIILYVFTGYISITGIISGSVDASTLKTAKLTISGVVPVVGNILSDATESVIVSAGIMKNSIGIYGIFAMIAICIEPFILIGTRYMLLKLCAAVCNIFGYKPAVSLIEDFSVGMGFILAMTGANCVMLLISVVCFLRGIGL